ncbi:MAG TPA: type II toxin-antitoxin system RelE/ParE family toxin [Tepidisphaeraceae bacterium]|jgi:plasmid stabilization system protein ParE|nr:type II toxin-antitoxin system RelE/ParE family toxin [Tepidisphaeraceae bacterium]
MIVDYTPEALANLDEIWDWNAERYGRIRADSYVEFLQRRTDRLSTEYARGRRIPANTKLRYRVIQRTKKRHGHIVVYEVNDDDVVRVLRYFHTAQDWQNKLQEEAEQE